jgi:hypothetical protein
MIWKDAAPLADGELFYAKASEKASSKGDKTSFVQLAAEDDDLGTEYVIISNAV